MENVITWGNVEMIICKNCGEELSDGSVFCNKCGYKVTETEIPIETMNEVAITVQDNTVNVKSKKTKKPIFISLLVVLILLVSGGGYWYFTTDQQKKEEAIVNTYKENLALAVTKMMGYSIVSEQICNQYSDVWNRAIEADYGIEVNGQHASDFNEAILYQREEYEEKDVLKSIKDNTAEVDKLMQGLNNPPAEYQNSYDKLVELYGLYTQYADEADSPKGSLVEFNKTTNELSSEISKLFNQFKVLLPNIDEKKISDYSDSADL